MHITTNVYDPPANDSFYDEHGNAMEQGIIKEHYLLGCSDM
jgi:hypothetical protein